MTTRALVEEILSRIENNMPYSAYDLEFILGRALEEMKKDSEPQCGCPEAEMGLDSCGADCDCDFGDEFAELDDETEFWFLTALDQAENNANLNWLISKARQAEED